MIRPDHTLMERGTKPQGVLREAQPAVDFVVLIDFLVFTSSPFRSSETVFLCPYGPVFN